MKSATALFMSLLMSLTVFAQEAKVQANKQIADEAIELVKLTVKQKNATYNIQEFYAQGGKVIVIVGYSYETSESGVACTKQVEFSKNAEGQTSTQILDGMCFS